MPLPVAVLVLVPPRVQRWHLCIAVYDGLERMRPLITVQGKRSYSCACMAGFGCGVPRPMTHMCSWHCKYCVGAQSPL